MDVIVRDSGRSFLRFPFQPAAHQWIGQNPPAEFCVSELGGIACFVKRQHNQFSGWGLLVKAIAERQIEKAPRIISIAKDDTHFYYFTERLKGQTLQEFRKIAHVSTLDTRKLVNDVFVSLKSINDHGYWYSDLCPKNIFVIDSKSFSLIDLDSCIAGTKSYEYHGKTSFEYPGLLICFAKEIVGNKSFNLRVIPGECVNQAEIVALAVEAKNRFVFPVQSKAKLVQTILMRDARIEFEDLFRDLVNKRPDWLKTRKLVDKVLG